MATYVAYTPTGAIPEALFNFDAFGIANFRLTGTVNVSVSDSFTSAQYFAAFPQLSSDVYTSLASGNGAWTASQLANIDLVASTYSNFIDLDFSTVADYSGYTPAGVGNASDINISLIYRPDLSFSGASALAADANFGYPGGRGDIVLNVSGFGSLGLSNDDSLDPSSFGFHVLMHEFGHSLGLSHPHSSIVNRTAVLTADFAETVGVGFGKLGFQIDQPSDMNKEYFTVMSYDDQTPAGEADTFAQTPMILDVIALQSAYGEGTGSSGAGNDVVTAGGGGSVAAYRTYFDIGGTDTINLANYVSGAYLNMGTTITGATHLVGVSMSIADYNVTLFDGDPASLRWYYGEFENAIGSPGNDIIFDNTLDNVISGGSGNDTVYSIYGGQDNLSGGPGDDTYAVYTAGTSIVESAGEGSDMVFSRETYTLGPNLENLWLDGILPIKGTGNALDNVLNGNSSANVLAGVGGNDTLNGYDGSDTAAYSGLRSEYTFTVQSDGSIRVADQRNGSPDGTDAVRNVELFQFSDGIFNAAGNRAPVAVPASANRSVHVGQSVGVASLFSAADADNDPITQYRFWDGGAAPSGGYFSLNGARQPDNQAINVSAADMPNLTWMAGSLPGSETVWVQASDWLAVGPWVSWTMSSTNAAPVTTATSAVQGVPVGQTLAAASLFSVSDADGDTPTIYRFWDSAGGGQFKVNGVAQAAGQNIDLSAAQLANTTYAAGSALGTEQVWIQVYDGTAWSAWTSWLMQSQRTTNQLPQVQSPVQKNVLQSQWLQLSAFVTVSDGDLDPMARFELRDLNAAAGSAHLWCRRRSAAGRRVHGGRHEPEQHLGAGRFELGLRHDRAARQ